MYNDNCKFNFKFNIDRGVQNFNGASESFEYGGFESEEDFDDEDFFDDVITGRQSMSGDDSTWEITKNMSPELLSLFGVADSVKGANSNKNTNTNINTKIAWQAPAKSGLDNSDPIIRTAFNSVPSIRGESSQYGSGSMNYNGEYNYDIDDEYDEEEDEDEDLLKYYSNAVNETLTEFLDDVITGRQNMSGDDSAWTITQNMSPGLLALFDLEGRSPSPTRNKIAWQPPAKSGLSNSEPILRTAYNVASVTTYSTTAPPSRPPIVGETSGGSRFRRNYEFSPEVGVVKRTGYNSNNGLRDSIQTQSVTTIETLGKDHEEEEEEEEEDEEDEEDDDEDDSSAGDLDMEEDEDAYADRILSMMSNNLKLAVGVRTNDAPLATDWRPPAHSGLQNSERIIR